MTNKSLQESSSCPPRFLPVLKVKEGFLVFFSCHSFCNGNCILSLRLILSTVAWSLLSIYHSRRVLFVS